MTKSEAPLSWAHCLAEGSDETRYPRAAPAEGGLKTWDEVLAAHQGQEINSVNPFRRPSGPTREHVSLIQKLWAEKMPVDQIAGVMVEMYPELERGAKGGAERERRIAVHGQVNIWVSDWAERVG